MQNFKERLSMIQLSDEQKKKLTKNVKRPTKRVSKLPLVVTPIFVVVALFFVFITLNDMQSDKSIVQSSASFDLLSGYPLSVGVLLFALINTGFILINSFWFRRNLRTVKRMQARFYLQELHVYFDRPLFFMFFIIVSQLILWGVTLSSTHAAIFNQGIFVVLAILFMAQGVIYESRNNRWCSCPHCQTKFTRWQMHRKSRMEYREKCDACQQPIVVTKDSYRQKIQFYIAPLTGIGLYTAFHFHIILVITFVVVLYFLNFYVFMPYTMEFYRDEEV